MKTPMLFMLCLAAATASAQGTKAPPTKADSVKAPPTKAAPAPGTKQDTKAAIPVVTKQAGKAPARPAPPVQAVAVPAPKVPVIMREMFGYAQEGRRDPFVSLLSTTELRPTITDLKLTGILYDESGSRSVAVMRDIATSELYRVRTGMTLGRMRVALIKRNVVIFSIEEFGLNRQDSLVLGDTTKKASVK